MQNERLAAPAILGIILSAITMLGTIFWPKPSPAPTPGPTPNPVVVDPQPQPKPPTPVDPKVIDNIKVVVEALPQILDLLKQLQILKAQGEADQAKIAALESKVQQLERGRTVDEAEWNRIVDDSKRKVEEALRRADNPAQPPSVEPSPVSQPAAASQKETVTLVTDPSWCAPCRQLEASIKAYGEGNLPFKIERRLPGPGESVPRLLWGKWQHVGYEPIEQFIRRWEYANGMQATGTVCQCVAVTGVRGARCQCLERTRNCHCTPSKPHRFDQ